MHLSLENSPRLFSFFFKQCCCCLSADSSIPSRASLTVVIRNTAYKASDGYNSNQAMEIDLEMLFLAKWNQAVTSKEKGHRRAPGSIALP